MKKTDTKIYNRSRDLFNKLTSDAASYLNLWKTASQISAVKIDPDYKLGSQSVGDSKDLDINDATAALANQSYADSLNGMIWDKSPDIISIRPSRYVKQITDNEQDLDGYFGFISDQLSYHANHSNAGFTTSLSSYSYEQSGIGTSGIGAWKNKLFKEKREDNAIVFAPYGVDNTMVDEGRNGKVTTVCIVNWWGANRIAQEFASDPVTGMVSSKLVEKNLPEKMAEAFKQNKVSETYKIIHLILPQDDYMPDKKGKKGFKYVGVYFTDDENEKQILRTDYYHELPVAICRHMKLRNEKYGRSPNTLLLQTVANLNFITGIAYDNVDKMTTPALGIWDGSVSGDGVIDDSAGGTTVFNQSQTGNSSPIFPMGTVGDVSGIVNFMIPELRNQITTAMKQDIMLDFNSQKDMTARETMERASIRSQALSSMLKQQEDELLHPLFTRCISILKDCGELGIENSEQLSEEQTRLLDLNENMLIPDEVMEVMKSGKPWFEIEFNNELSRVLKTQKLQGYLQFLDMMQMTAQFKPEIIQAFDWYAFIKEVSEILGIKQGLFVDEKEFEEELTKSANMNAASAGLEADNVSADTSNKRSQAEKNNTEANANAR